MTKFTAGILDKLKTSSSDNKVREASNSVTSTEQSKIKEAVRDANDPKRLVSEPPSLSFSR